MTHRIIILTDFSKASKNAADFVLSHMTADDEVLLYHNFSHLTRFMPLNSVNAIDSYAEEIAEKLEKEKERIKLSHPQNHQVVKIKFDIGFAANNLHRIVERYDPGLIVVGTKADAKEHEGWILTKYSALALETKCPLLLIPEESKVNQLNEIICVHNSEDRIVSFESILHEMFVLKEPKLHLLLLKDDDKTQRNFFAPAKEKASNSSKEKNLDVLEFDNDVSGIRGYSNALNADLIVVNLDTPGFFEQLTKGDIRKDMIANTHKPLLILGEQHI